MLDDIMSLLQIVWADSDQVGCGLQQCANLRYTYYGLGPAVFLVCNYGPGQVLKCLAN